MRKKKNACHNQQGNRVFHELQQTKHPLFVNLSAVLESNPLSLLGKLGGSSAAVSALSCPQLVCKGQPHLRQWQEVLACVHKVGWSLNMGKHVSTIIIGSVTHDYVMMWSTMSNVSGEKALDTANMQIFPVRNHKIGDEEEE